MTQNCLPFSATTPPTHIGLLLALSLLLLVSGCMPRTIVRKNPAPQDQGVRYYRPKPYLKIAPQLDKNNVPSAQFVSIDLAYLPDFSEEYSIHVKSGLGTNQTQITLDQGWNLTSLNVDIDSQTAENIEAVGSLLDSVPRLAAAANGNPFVVAATNVPIGYYEAVLGQHCGRKQLYGFRYIGFLPFATCPHAACGTGATLDCYTHSDALYGLVFENGQMTFKKLVDVAVTDHARLNRRERVENLEVPQRATIRDKQPPVAAESLQVPAVPERLLP